MISVVIASLGTNKLIKTLNSLNSGSFKPDEIIVCVPTSSKLIINKDKFLNVKIIFSKIMGQVYQRSLAINESKNEIIFQLDDDMILDKYCLEKLLIAYRKKNQGNVFGSSWYCNKKYLHLSHHARKENIVNYIKDILDYILIGAPYGINKLGKMTKEGFCYGIDTKYFKSNIISCDWLPGGCVLGNKVDFIEYNFYPYEGKAYCEDILNSILRNKKKISHHVVKDSIIYSEIDREIVSKKRYIAEIKIREYIRNINNGNKFRLWVWKNIFYFKNIINIHFNK